MADYSPLLVDADVCLDVILNRDPHRVYSQKVLSLCEEARNIEGYISSLSYSNIFYLISKDFSLERVYDVLTYLEKMAHIASVTEEMTRTAIQKRWPDFEDALQHECAIHYNCNAIITRNISDYKESKLPVFSPFEFLNL